MLDVLAVKHERPPIGVTTGPFVDSAGRHKQGQTNACTDAVNRAGGIGVPIAYMSDPTDTDCREAFEAACCRVRGLVIAGGNDLNPRLYGELPRTDVLDPISDEQDASDLLAFTLAEKLSIPILGICRGAQVINVARDGSLHQNLPDLRGDIQHLHPQRDPSHRHFVTIEQSSRLGRLVLPRDMGLRFLVNTLHHQGIKETEDQKLGRDLRVVARAEDGIVEAIEDIDATKFILGVQWHPETLKEFAFLFEALINEIRTPTVSLLEAAA
jgi:putative glutamine amidotransferase